MLLLLMLLLSQINNPFNVDYVNLTIENKGVVTATGQYSDLNISLHIPQETSYQDIKMLGCISNCELYKDSENYVALIKDNGPSNMFSYRTIFEVNSHARKFSGNKNYSVPKELFKYVKSTEHIKINDEIRKLAHKITENESGDINKIYSLAKWVNQNINYNPKYSETNIPSDEVLKLREGVCSEYTNLFCALARSMGYPTRVVLGYVYVNGEGWTLHAWAEVYLGEWVGVDPTWLEMGYIDATHIPIVISNDTYYSDKISAVLGENDNLKWDSYFSLGSTISGITINNYSETPLNYDINYEPKNLKKGTSGYFIINVMSDSYRAINLPIVSCKGPIDVVNVKLKEYKKLLHPGINSFYIPFKINSNLRSNMVYNCPTYIGLNSVNLKIRTDEYEDKSFNVTKIIDDSGLKLSLSGPEDESYNIYEEDKLPNIFSPKFGGNTYNSSSEWIIISNGYHAYLFENKEETTPEINIINLYIQPFSYDDDYVNIKFRGKLKFVDIGYFNIYLDDVKLITNTFKGSELNYSNKIKINEVGTHKICIDIQNGGPIYHKCLYTHVYSSKLSLIPQCSNDNIYTFKVDGHYKYYKLSLDDRPISSAIKLEPGRHIIKINWIDLNGKRRVSYKEIQIYGINDYVKLIVLILVVMLIAYIILKRWNNG